MSERLGGAWYVPSYSKVEPERPPPPRLGKQQRQQNSPFARTATATKERATWVDTPAERRAAGRTLSAVFTASFLLVVATGALTLLSVPQADRDYEGLAGRVDSVNCLRLARRADYPVVFVALGAPTQWLKLVLRMDYVLDDEYDSMVLFAERMHKSQTMVCTPFDPPHPYQERCEDVAMIYNGTDRQSYVRTRFTFQNDYVEASIYKRASLVGLDGYMYLVAGTTYWITNTHLCFAPHDPASAVSDDALPFAPGNSTTTGTAALRVAFDALRAHPETEAFPVADADQGACGNLSHPDGARLFPVDAAAEQNSWLSLSSNFLYEYGQNILEMRREALELGEACATCVPTSRTYMRSTASTATSTTPPTAGANTNPRWSFADWRSTAYASTWPPTAPGCCARARPPRSRASPISSRTAMASDSPLPGC